MGKRHVKAHAGDRYIHGTSFSLEWKPCKADNEKELDTADLEQILLRDRELLTLDDIEK